MIKALKRIRIFCILLLIFRGWIYRFLVEYKVIGERQEIGITNPKLIELIEEKSIAKKMNIDEIADVAEEITTKTLTFTWSYSSNDTNDLFNEKKANCVGYAAMFNSISNFLIRKYHLQDEFVASHKIGELELLGFNIHPYFNSPFYKNHDYNTISNLTTGEKLSLDPSLSDYFWIDRIKEKH